MAAFMQAWRNAFQKQLSTTVDVYGVTLARFIFALPLALLYISCLYHFQPVTDSVHFNLRFAIYVLIAALSQIAATALMVQLFKQKNYAIGVGLAKSEAVLAAIIAVVFLSFSFFSKKIMQLEWVLLKVKQYLPRLLPCSFYPII